MKQYRLLNEGEIIKEGDECLSCDMQWTKPGVFKVGDTPYAMGRINEFYTDIFRRPIESPWIDIKKRKPAKEDGRTILVCSGISLPWLEDISNLSVLKCVSHWMPIPSLPSVDPFEEVWEKHSRLGPFGFFNPGDNQVINKAQARAIFEEGKLWEANA